MEPAGVPDGAIGVAVQRVAVPAENVTFPVVTGPTGRKLAPAGGLRTAVKVMGVFRYCELAGLALVTAISGVIAVIV